MKIRNTESWIVTTIHLEDCIPISNSRIIKFIEEKYPHLKDVFTYVDQFEPVIISRDKDYQLLYFFDDVIYLKKRYENTNNK